MSSQPAGPMNAQRERNPHRVALAALAATLADPTPCASEDSRLWISEDRDQREWAAGLCVGCPLLAACRAAGRAEVFGIWGGRDRSPVRPAEPAGPEFESGSIRILLLVSESRWASGHRSGHNAAEPGGLAGLVLAGRVWVGTSSNRLTTQDLRTSMQRYERKPDL